MKALSPARCPRASSPIPSNLPARVRGGGLSRRVVAEKSRVSWVGGSSNRKYYPIASLFT